MILATYNPVSLQASKADGNLIRAEHGLIKAPTAEDDSGALVLKEPPHDGIDSGDALACASVRDPITVCSRAPVMCSR